MARKTAVTAKQTQHIVHESERIALAQLKPHPRNYRVHPEDQLQHIMHSITTNGFYRNVVVAKDYTILAGHGSVEAARRLELSVVPVVRLNVDSDSPIALRILAGDNEVGKLAEVNDRALTEMLREIKDSDVGGLLGSGFDENMLAALVFNTRPAAELSTDDDAAHWVGMPAYSPNRIRKHVLLITFDDVAEREQFAQKNELVIHKKVGNESEGSSWSTCYPPRGRDDIASLRFKTGE